MSNRAKNLTESDSVRAMRAAVHSMTSRLPERGFRFWKIKIPGAAVKPEEFYAATMADAFILAKKHWPWAEGMTCIGSRT